MLGPKQRPGINQTALYGFSRLSSVCTRDVTVCAVVVLSGNAIRAESFVQLRAAIKEETNARVPVVSEVSATRRSIAVLVAGFRAEAIGHR